MITRILADLDKIPPSKQRENSKLTVEFFDDIRWDLDRVSDILIPRILQFSDDQKVIDAAIGLDYARDQFENAVIVERRISIGIDLFDLCFLLREIHELLQTFVEKWD